ncbi:MAG: hypothetical protein IJO35_01905 [Methanocorpusculum sp.]|nr:hypothetical protein [Methanocorpusculum sp.]
MRRTDPISGYSYNTRGSGKAKWIILLVAVAVVAVAATCAVFFLLNGDDSPSKPSGGGLIIDSGAGEYVDTPKTSVAQSVAIPSFGTITIPANTQTVSVHLYNPASNEGLYYLTFRLLLEDTGEVLYESNAVPPGKHIQQITLNRGLSAGVYDAVVHVQPYRMADETPTNNANMRTTLIVQ